MSKETELIANLSQNYRSVTFSDIRVVSPGFIIDPDIKDENGLTFDVGIKGRKESIISYDLTAFAVLYNDRIGIVLDDRANRVRKNIGNAFIAGTESLINVNFLKWWAPKNTSYKISSFLNSSFSFSEYLSSEENNVVGKRVEFIPAVNIKTGLDLSYKNLQFVYQIGYLSKQYTDVQNSSIAAQGDSRSGLIGEIPAYQISDVTLTYKIGKFKFDAGINNLFNSAYFTRRATGYPGPGIIPSDGRSFFFTAMIKT